MKPVNRYIQLEELANVDEQQTQSIVAVPDTYVNEYIHKLYKVTGIAHDAAVDVFTGDTVLVDNRMIQRVDIGSGELIFVLENYVIGVV